MLPVRFVGVPLEMTKRRWRELMQGLYENHFDPRKDEELKQSKLDVENKLSKILKLVKERRSNRRNRNVEANLRKESELIELIENFHKQYQFVYGQYDDIRGHLSQTVNGAKEDEGFFTATSSSDSDTEPEIDVNRKNESIMSSEHMEAKNKAQESEKKIQELKEKLDEKGREISSLIGIQTHCQKEVSGFMKDLELEFSSLNRRLDGLRFEKIVTEQRMENRQLQDRTLKLEKIAKEVTIEISQLVKNGVEGATEEDELVSDMSVKELVAQVNNLKLNVEHLISNAQKTDSKQQKTSQGSKNGYAVHENLLDQVNNMKRDLGLMRKKNTELESNIKKKAQESSGFLSQINDLKKHVASKTEELQNIQKERDDSEVRMKKLELEAGNLISQKSEGEKLIARKEQEQLKTAQEIEELRANMAKMEKMLKEEEDDKSAQIVALMAQINRLEQELELKDELERQIKMKDNEISKLTEERKSIKERISELEKKLLNKDMQRKMDEQISSHDKEICELGEEKESLEEKVLELEMALTEREDEIADLQRSSQVGENEVSYLQGELSVERKKFLERLNELENENNELRFKVSDQEFRIKQYEDTIKKLREDCKLVKGRFLLAAERKMDEVVADCRKNFEDQLRILSRRIRVAEQLHVETKESWKRTQESCDLQHPGLNKKHAQMMVPSCDKSELRATFSQAIGEMMKGMEDLVSNFKSKEEDFLQRLSKVSNEVQVTKNWVQWTMDGIKPLKNEPPQGSPVAPTMDNIEQDKMMKEKLRRLEAKVNKEKGDKLRLIKGMYEIQKKVAELENEAVTKDEGLLRLGEEKVEAIRQLCMCIDYQQNRFDQLKEVMLELVKKNKSKGRA